MKKIVLSSLLLVGMLFGGDVDDKTKKLIQDIIPATKIAAISQSQISGLYKVYLQNDGIIYIFPSKELIFFGEIYTKDGLSITEQDAKGFEIENQKLASRNINVNNLIQYAEKKIFNNGGTKFSVILFTDPDCPFCQKVDDYLKQKNATVYYNYMPLDTIHPKARDKVIKILGANKEALSRLKKMEDVAREMAVKGTPKIYILDESRQEIIDIINGADIARIDAYMNGKN